MVWLRVNFRRGSVALLEPKKGGVPRWQEKQVADFAASPISLYNLGIAAALDNRKT